MSETVRPDPDRNQARLGPRGQRTQDLLDAACRGTCGGADDIGEALDEGGRFSHRCSLVSDLD
ncbi:hypothetical protein MKK64_02385 [Methylobacterium sp. E-025]|uniref:hypothetical protein n=1 Tax=Methylobacterium sp. E-025 TaxID=2836561 RepID=UPI001FBBB2C7|nr:hypothetical protein [Methylobacterium sp. E-025]MCJ2110067.1 hypothetical protein [Methylobacterium sp. E-025]